MQMIGAFGPANRSPRHFEYGVFERLNRIYSVCSGQDEVFRPVLTQLFSLIRALRPITHDQR
jgi:hypothetical protein